MADTPPHPNVAIACGGTGGHLFPGIAVADALDSIGCHIRLLVSPKEIDQATLRSQSPWQILTLPARAQSSLGSLGFVAQLARSFSLARRCFLAEPPHAVLGMGGFSSFAPMAAGRTLRAALVLHEANAIPGRANRWIARWSDHAYVHFPSAGRRLRCRQVTCAGMPLRSRLQPQDPSACRLMLGLHPDHPTLLVVGGSQGATPVNQILIRSIPLLARHLPSLQFLHLTGPADAEAVRSAYAAHGRRAIVRPFLTEIELALNAASVAISRAGASALAEFAALRLPAILIPYPHAADNHQHYNALAFADCGAARLLAQSSASPEQVARWVLELAVDLLRRRATQSALGRWHRPQAARDIAAGIVQLIRDRFHIQIPRATPALDDGSNAPFQSALAPSRLPAAPRAPKEVSLPR